MRAASHDVGAQNAIENEQSFGDVVSVARHGIGARNAIENFLKWTKLLEMLRVPQVKILAREMRLKSF